jgi:hypothetical protein
VVRDGVEPPTFRFSEALLPLEPPGTHTAPAPSCQHYGWSELMEPILAAVPPCAGYARIACGFLVGSGPEDPDLWGFRGGEDRVGDPITAHQTVEIAVIHAFSD